jgi:hypothetical protein
MHIVSALSLECARWALFSAGNGRKGFTCVLHIWIPRGMLPTR